MILQNAGGIKSGGLKHYSILLNLELVQNLYVRHSIKTGKKTRTVNSIYFNK